MKVKKKKKTQHISLLPIENQDQMKLWGSGHLIYRRRSLLGKKQAQPALASHEQYCVYLFMPFPSVWRENNEPACLKFFLPFYIMACFISFHFIWKGEVGKDISDQSEKLICLQKSTEGHKRKGEVSEAGRVLNGRRWEKAQVAPIRSTKWA